MEPRHIIVYSLLFNDEMGDWEACGVSERYAMSVSWRATRPARGQRWQVWIPAGQLAGEEWLGLQSLALEDPPLADDVRRELTQREWQHTHSQLASQLCLPLA